MMEGALQQHLVSNAVLLESSRTPCRDAMHAHLKKFEPPVQLTAESVQSTAAYGERKAGRQKPLV